MSILVRERAESALVVSVELVPGERPTGNVQALREPTTDLGVSQNELARRADVNSSLLSQIVFGEVISSPTVLRQLHAVLLQPSKAEPCVMPAEVKVMGWRKGKRKLCGRAGE